MSPTDLGRKCGLFSHCPALGLLGQMGLALTLLLYWPVISSHVHGSRVGDTTHSYNGTHCTGELECKPIYFTVEVALSPSPLSFQRRACAQG